MAPQDGCAEFQEMMLNFFGDRDYVSFDGYELKKLEEVIYYALYGTSNKTTKKENTKENEEKIRKEAEEKNTMDKTNKINKEENKKRKYQEEENRKKEEEKQKKEERKKNQKVQSLLDIIVKESNSISKWKDRVIISVIYNCLEPLPKEKQKRTKKYPDYKPEYDLNPIPIFVLRKCKNSEHPCRIFIDDTGRVYQSWDQYLKENTAWKGLMVLPKDGRYQQNSEGKVILERHFSPACGFGTKILQTADTASAVGGVVSGIVFATAAIPAFTVAPFALVGAAVAGVGLGGYSIGRSIYTLHDRAKHKETLSFANSESRGAYLNIVAGAMGFVGAGANMALSQIVARGFNISNGAKAAFNTVNIMNLGVSGANVANASYEVLNPWINEDQKPSALQIVQLTSSILFFGHAMYNFQTANTLIQESQAKNLSEYLNSLQSNKQERMFNKLLKETVRQNHGNVQQGQAQVIKAIRNMGTDKEKVLVTLGRWNKEFNRSKVRFAVNDGKVTLNGFAVDIMTFGSMDQNRVVTYLGNLPGTPNPTQGDIRTLSISLKNAFGALQPINWNSLALNVFQILGNANMTIREKIINATSSVILALVGDPLNDWFEEIFKGYLKYVRILKVVTDYFQILVDDVEKKYKNWIKTTDPMLEEPYFSTLSLDVAKRAAEIFNKVSNLFFIGNNLTQKGLNLLLNHLYNCVAEEIFEYQQNKERKQERKNRSDNKKAPKVKCPKCNGEFYDRKSIY